MADAKITISVDGAQLAEDTFARVNDAMKQTGQTTQDTGAAMQGAGGHASELQQHLEDLKPSTEHAGAAFSDLKSTLMDMWENPTKALGDFSHAIAGDLTESLGGASSGLGMAAIGIGAFAGAAVAAGAAAYELTTQVAEVGAAIERASLITGIGAEDMSALKFAAEVTGGSLDQLTNMAFMLEKKLGDTGAGGDKARAALEKLGISADDFVNLPVDQQVLAISEGFRGLEEGTNKASIAFDLLGRQGRDALPTLMQPMDDLVQKAHDLGLTWSDQDVKAAHDFEIQSNTLRAELGKLGTDIGKTLIPIALDLAQALERALHPGAGNTSGSLIDPAQADLVRKYGAALKDDGDNAWTTAAAMDGLTLNIHTQASAIPALVKAHEDNTGAVKQHTQTVQDYVFVGPIYLEALKSVVPPLYDSTKAMAGITAQSAKWTAVIPDLTAHLQDTHAILHPLNETAINFGIVTLPNVTSSLHDADSGFSLFVEDLGQVSRAFTQLAQVSGTGVFADFTKDIAVTVSSLNLAQKGMAEFGKEGATTGDKIAGLATEGAAFVQATSKGGLMGVLSGAATGAEIGMQFGPIGAGVGAVAGAVVSAIRSIGAASEEELGGRKLEKTFEDSFGGFDKMMAAVGTAYAETGKTAAQAQADVKSLLDAEKQGPAATQTWIDAITATMAAAKVHEADVATGTQSILDAAKTVGTNFPAAMQPMIASLASLPGLTDAEKNSLLGLASAGQPSLNDLTSAAGRYGLSLDSIGGKAAQLSISTQADQIESDYKTLVTTSGADSDKVLAGMKTSLTKLVDHAMDAGAVLPTALEPLVKQLADTGQLTDTAGNKITDLSKLHFNDAGDPLANGMKSLTDAINHLGDLLSPSGLPKKATDAAATIGNALGGIKSPNLTVDVNLNGHWNIPTAPDIVPMAAGGDFIVTQPTLFLAGEKGPERATFGGAGNTQPGGPRGAGGLDAGKLHDVHQELVGMREEHRRSQDLLRSTLATLPIMMRAAMRG